MVLGLVGVSFDEADIGDIAEADHVGDPVGRFQDLGSHRAEIPDTREEIHLVFDGPARHFEDELIDPGRFIIDGEDAVPVDIGHILDEVVDH